jgi:PD-(D/E)XK nuclease superfamily protein
LVAVHARAQGDLGEASAIEWLVGIGARVFLPFGHSPDCDLVADLDGRLVRVQAKTSSFHRGGHDSRSSPAVRSLRRTR